MTIDIEPMMSRFPNWRRRQTTPWPGPMRARGASTTLGERSGCTSARWTGGLCSAGQSGKRLSTPCSPRPFSTTSRSSSSSTSPVSTDAGRDSRCLLVTPVPVTAASVAPGFSLELDGEGLAVLTGAATGTERRGRVIALAEFSYYADLSADELRTVTLHPEESPVFAATQQG